MAILKPFKGVRPKQEFAEKVASPPYDVLNSEEAREIVKENKISFLHVIKPEIDLPDDINIYDESVYLKGKENLDKMISDGILMQDNQPYIYLYRQIMNDNEQYGIVGCVSADDYDNDIIKKHEKTRVDKENDRTKHVITLEANSGPVFLTYKSNDTINNLVNTIANTTPEYDFTADDDIQHTFWIIKDKNYIEQIISEFENVPYLYVADGHHRSASGSRAREYYKSKNPNHTGNEEYNFFLAVLFPHDQLKILPYNRAVKNLNNNSIDEFIQKISERFNVSETDIKKPQNINQICMYMNKKWYLLEIKDVFIKSKSPIDILNVSTLQNNILEPILNIKNPKSDENIDFIGGIRGTKELERIVDNGNYKVAFSMYPTTVENLMDIADNGMIMPPKSTWFEPKLRSGLIVHLLK